MMRLICSVAVVGLLLLSVAGCRDHKQNVAESDDFMAGLILPLSEAEYQGLLKTYLAEIDLKAAEYRQRLDEGARSHSQSGRAYSKVYRRKLEKDEEAVYANLQAGRKHLSSGGNLDTEGWCEPGSIYPYIIADCPASARLVMRFHREGAFGDVTNVLSVLRSQSLLCGEYEDFIEEVLRSESVPAPRRDLLTIILFSAGSHPDRYKAEVRRLAVEGNVFAAVRMLFEMAPRTGEWSLPRRSAETNELLAVLATPSADPRIRYVCACHAEATGDRARVEEICAGLLSEEYKGGAESENKLADYGLCQHRQFAMSLLFYGARTENAFRLLFLRATAADPAMQDFPSDRRDEEIGAAGFLVEQVRTW